jgi:putative membrane protein
VNQLVHILPHVNATLNAIATVLLIVGYVLIKRGREQAHIRTMLAAFGVSVVFLICYLTYHSSLRTLSISERRLPATVGGGVRYSYYAMLISHIVLAATVPVLACLTIWYGYRDQRARHRRLAWWTFPIWLYVSVTGVLIYLVLYQVYGS